MQHIPDFEKDAAAKLELEGLSPALFQIQNQAQEKLPIAEDMPTDYFDNLFEDVWGKIQAESPVQTFKPITEEVTTPSIRLITRPKFWYAAASIALLLTTAITLTWSSTETIEPKTMAQADFNTMLDKISVDEIATYLIDNSDELDLKSLAVSDNAYDALQQELVGQLITDDSFYWDY